MFYEILASLTCLKILLIPSYTSTDFEVHRNWLAITFSQPVKRWYVEDTSQWTLDYPPFFAWFEYLLSQIAYFFDPEMLNVKNLDYKSDETLLFQRLSVIAADFVYAYGVKECGKFLRETKLRKSSKWKSKWNSPSAIVITLLLTNATLIMVDNIHFQYNGFLFGVWLLSMVRMLQGRNLESAMLFSVLLNLKHIFMYVAPAYFVFLLKNYCLNGKAVSPRSRFVKNSLKLGSAVTLVFLLSFGPFVYYGQLSQVLSRLFPFKRGLTHAYWAPNWWALYNAVDKLLLFVAKKFGFHVIAEAGSMSGGLVQQYEHTILPSITPAHTFVITFLAMMPGLYKLWTNPGNPFHFVRCLITCAFSSFVFGWHVHEKAILLPIVPLTFMSIFWRQEAVIFLLLSTVGHYSVFPLLYQPFETPIKVLLALTYSIYAFRNLPQLYNVKRSSLSFSLLNSLETLYILSLVPLFAYEHVFQYVLGLHIKFPFLPLMLTSVHNAIGVLYCYVKYYSYFLKMKDENHKRKAY